MGLHGWTKKWLKLVFKNIDIMAINLVVGNFKQVHLQWVVKSVVRSLHAWRSKGREFPSARLALVKHLSPMCTSWLTYEDLAPEQETDVSQMLILLCFRLQTSAFCDMPVRWLPLPSSCSDWLYLMPRPHLSMTRGESHCSLIQEKQQILTARLYMPWVSNKAWKVEVSVVGQTSLCVYALVNN